MSSPQKISQLTTAGPLTGAELVPVVQNGGTLQTTISVLAAFVNVSILPVVSALQTQIEQVSALTSINAESITSLNAVVSTFDSRIEAVSAGIVSVNNAVSALEVRVSSVSAAASNASAAITSINNAVSALEIRVSAASATGAANSAAITSVNNVVSALDIRLTNVSASVSVLNVQMGQALASISAINSVLATIDTSAIAGLEVRVSNLSIAVSTNSAAITSVNAVVSLKVFRNNDFLTNVQYIDFNTTTSYAHSAGRLTWDTQLGTLDLGLKGTVNLPVGQRQVIQVFNNSGVTLPVNKVVRLNGAFNGRPTAALAQANSDANSQNTIGIMLETVSASSTGYVATSGVVRSFDTDPYADGAFLWLSPVSAGEMTATKPTALTGRAVEIGIVVKANPFGITQGALVLNLREGYDLNELHNVYVSTTASLADGEVLAWNTRDGVWENSPALINAQASISALNVQLAAVSARTSVNAAAITSINNVVSALEIRVSTVSARASAIQAQVNSVSALVSALDVRVAAVSASISALQVQVNNVSAALTSANNVVSALEIRVSSASAAISVNTAAITSINNVVSALEIRVSAASATGATNSASITSINAVLTSILAILNSNYRVLE